MTDVQTFLHFCLCTCARAHYVPSEQLQTKVYLNLRVNKTHNQASGWQGIAPAVQRWMNRHSNSPTFLSTVSKQKTGEFRRHNSRFTVQSRVKLSFLLIKPMR